MKGMALIVSLLFVLLLALFSFVMVLLAGSYYSSARNLIEMENARLMCDSVSAELIQKHNQETDPRLFLDPDRWISRQMKPEMRFGYEILASLEQPWSMVRGNLLTVTVRKGAFTSRQNLWVRQIRLEDFAFYLKGLHVHDNNSLFDGLVFAEMMELQKPDVRFRDRVYGSVTPAENASFRKPYLQPLDFPDLKDLITIEALQDEAFRSGLIISTEDPLLRSGESYRVFVDHLKPKKKGKGWSIYYSEKLLGETRDLHLFFDAPVHIAQSDAQPLFSPYPAPEAPVMISSSADIHIESNLRSFRGPDAVHPLALISAGSIRVDSTIPRLAVIDAMLVGLGSETVDDREFSLIIDPGSTAATELQKGIFLQEMTHSVFLLEEKKKMELMQSLEAGQRILWFREPVVVRSALKIPMEVFSVHFEASSHVFPVLPSFPFVHILEGSRQWH